MRQPRARPQAVPAQHTGHQIGASLCEGSRMKRGRFAIAGLPAGRKARGIPAG